MTYIVRADQVIELAGAASNKAWLELRNPKVTVQHGSEPLSGGLPELVLQERHRNCAKGRPSTRSPQRTCVLQVLGLVLAEPRRSHQLSLRQRPAIVGPRDGAVQPPLARIHLLEHLIAIDRQVDSLP